MALVEIARFADVFEAEIAAARLRAEGFSPNLGGAEHAKTDPFMLQTLGWVRLRVPPDQETRARAFLDAVESGAEALASEDPADVGRPDRTLPAKVGLGAAILALFGLT